MSESDLPDPLVRKITSALTKRPRLRICTKVNRTLGADPPHALDRAEVEVGDSLDVLLDKSHK